MKYSRRKNENNRQKQSYLDYKELLLAEKERSQRHNRFFIIFGIVVIGHQRQKIMKFVQQQLRASDYVFVVRDNLDQDHILPLHIGTLLPETDAAGGKVVKERLLQMFTLHGIPFQLGMAVYPDDATSPDKLLEMAFKKPLPAGASCREFSTGWSLGLGI